MKKYSVVLFVVMLLALALVGASAYAEGIVTTNPDIYVGEYEHGRIDFSDDKEVLIVFGNASIVELDGVTERGVALTSGGETKYFPATNYDKTNGNFGVALIKSTIPSGDYVAKAYAVVGGIVQEGASLNFDFDTTLTADESEITVTANQSVDLKNFITVSDGDKDEIVYTVATEDSAVLAINNGVVSYVSGHGTATITAKHAFSGSSVEFTATVWDKIVPINTKDELSALATLTTADSYAYLTDDIEVTTADIVSASGTNVTDTVVPGEFKGTFDGKGFKVGYAWDYRETTRWSETSENSFGGVFENIALGATVRNLVVEGMSVVPYDYVSLFAYTNNGLVENCFVQATTFAYSGRNYAATRFIFNAQGGEVRDCVFKVESASGTASSFEDTYCGVGLQRYGAGHWYDIAWISYQKQGAWQGGVNTDYPNKPDGQLHNVVYYASTADFIADVGSTYTIATAGSTSADGTTIYDKETDVFTDITEPQTLGASWSKDSAEGLKFNGEVVLVPSYSQLDYVSTDNGSIVFTEAGQTETIKMYFAEEESHYFTMSSADSDVATVTASGKVTAVGVGATTITVRHAFSNKAITIRVVFADPEKTYAISSASDLVSLDTTKMSSGSAYAYLTGPITVTKEDMVTVASGSNTQYTIIPLAAYGTSTTSGFKGVLDGKGYPINYTFEATDTTESFIGFVRSISDTGLLRNLVVNGDVTAPANGTVQITYYNKGHIDNCLFNTNVSQTASGGKAEYRTHIVQRNAGIVRNSIFISNYDYMGTYTTNRLHYQVHGGYKLENCALVGIHSRIATTDGATGTAMGAGNYYGISRYVNLEDFIAGTGTIVTGTAIDETSTFSSKYYHTPFTSVAKKFGKFVVDSTNKTITMDVDGVDKVVYTTPAN